MDRFNLNKKFVLITGAGGFLAKEIVSSLLKINARLILTDNDQKKLTRLKKKYKKQKKTIKVFEMDVTKEKSIKNVLNALKRKKIKIKILVNNAAIDPKYGKKNRKSIKQTHLENLELNDWDKQISVGLTGSMLCSKFFGAEMAKDNKGGVILNIASDLSVISPNQNIYISKIKNNLNMNLKKPISYSAVKFGLIGITKYLATYWPDKNIRCNAISPGGIFNKHPKKFVKKLSNLVPLGRMGKLHEIGSAVQFLCSDASSYVTGHNLVIDGGRSIW